MPAPPLRKIRIWGSVAFALLVLWWGLLAVGIPLGLRHGLENKAPEILGGPLSVGKIRFSPFSFSLRMEDLVFGKTEDPGIRVGRVVVDLGVWNSLFSRRLVISGMDMETPFIRLGLDPEGHLDPGGIRLASAPPEEREGPGSKTKETGAPPPFPLLIQRLDLTGGALSFHDAGRNFSESLSDIRVRALMLGTEPDKKGRLWGEWRVKSGGTCSFDLSLGLNPISVSGHVGAGALALPAFSAFLPGTFTGKLDAGLFSMGLDILFENNTLSLPHFKGHISDLHILHANKDPFFSLKTLRLSGGPLEPAKQSYSLESLLIQHPRLHAERSSEGLRIPILLPPASASPDLPVGEAEEDSALFWVLNHLQLEDGEVRFTDILPDEKAELFLENLSLSVETLAFPAKADIPFRFSASVNGGGKAGISGDLRLDPLRISTSFSFEKIGLRPFSPYLQTHAGLFFPGGAAGFSGKAGWDASQGLRLEADTRLDGLSLQRMREKEAFFSLDTFRLQGVEVEEHPLFRICIKDGLLKGARFRLDRDPEGIRPFVLAIPREVSSSAEPSAKEREAQKPRLCVQDFRMEDNRFTFYDRAVSPVFHTEIRDIGARVRHVDTGDPEKRFTLELTALKDGQSPLSLNLAGKMADFTENTGLALELDDFEMASISPYSRTYVARPLERGKMRIRLDWKVTESRLDMGNHLRIEGLRLGGRIPDTDAPNLPLGLAQALLEDKNGVIQIDLPVTGRLDDPHFRIGPTLWRAFTGLLTRLATSPFSALAGLGGESLRSEVLFSPGLSEMDMENRDHLRRIAASLKERPRLQLEISAVTGPEDSRALALASLESEVQARMNGTDEREKVIRVLYREKTGKAPEDDNMDVILERLAELESVDSGVEARLAGERLEAVRHVLTVEGGIASSRLFLREGTAQGAPAVRFSLDVK